jgi:DNA-binding beta-propeller fold protein YncE
MLKSYQAKEFFLTRILALLVVAGISPAAFAFGPGELFVANYNANSVTVYSRTASGIGTPRRTIRTGLSNPLGLLVDPLHGEIFVANSTNGIDRIGSIQVYDLNADYPQDTPKRTISGPATGLIGSAGLALDFLRQELYVANDNGSSITVYPRTANGDVAPLRTIEGSATALNGPVSVTLDLIHDELIVVNKVNYLGGGGLITVYHRASQGNVNPIRTIGGSRPGFNLPVHMDLDLLHDEIIVANAFANNVLVFNRKDNGDVAPKRTLSGPSTGLCMPFAVLADILNNELVVSSAGFDPTGCRQGTEVYSLGASGNATPKRSLDLGPAGGPPNPVSIGETLLSLQ